MKEKDLYVQIVKRTGRVPFFLSEKGDGQALARQLDITLMDVGFKLSQELLSQISTMHPLGVQDISGRVLNAVRQLVGDHVKHNTYFKDFPENVPDTLEFWCQCIVKALQDPRSQGIVSEQLASGVVNLLDLPDYGRYRHSYQEMVEAHHEFIPSLKDRMTILHIGGSVVEESLKLYHQFAGSPVPLNEEDRDLLALLAEACLSDEQPTLIPVRENRALINKVRFDNSQALLIDTVTDVLRLACALSEGDVTLEKPTRFKSLSRPQRGQLMGALDELVSASPAKLADVKSHQGAWKRLGERLHPHEYPGFPGAQRVFAIARGEEKVRTFASRLEQALSQGDIEDAVRILVKAPGQLMRHLDELLRQAITEAETQLVLRAMQGTVGKVSGRVILSAREHLMNRQLPEQNRIFANRKGTAWVTKDSRAPLEEETVERALSVFDLEIAARLPKGCHLVVDPAVLTVALPLSEKNKASGFGIMPRGTTTPVDTGILRFFMHWRQTHDRTDYDLSVLLLDERYQNSGHVSWTRLRDGLHVHSGDIVEAPNGATEFIDIHLDKADCTFIVPQVNVYAGEGFMQVDESFFGYMNRTVEQEGLPFEARTVQMKSELRGSNRVALPLVFIRDEKDQWQAKWLQMFLKGQLNFNRVEGNRVTTAMIVRSIVERRYLTLNYLVNLMRPQAESFTWYQEGMAFEESGPVTFIGLNTPEGLPEGSKVINLNNLTELIPQ